MIELVIIPMKSFMMHWEALHCYYHRLRRYVLPRPFVLFLWLWFWGRCW